MFPPNVAAYSEVNFFFITICGQFSFLFFFFFFTSRPFLLIFSLSEIQAVISVSLPVRTLRLLDHFGDVTAVKEVVLM